MRLGVFIQNHYKRDASPIVNRIKAQAPDVPVRVATDTTDYYALPPSLKTKYKGLNKNFFERIIGYNIDDYDWKLSVQDDIIIADGFMDVVQGVLEGVTNDVPIMIQFYTPDIGRVDEEADTHVVPIKDGYTNVYAIAFNQKFLHELYDWFFSLPLITQLNEGEDFIIRGFCSENKKRVGNFIIKPSLSQHEGYDKSILGHPKRTGKFVRKSSYYDETTTFTQAEIEQISSRINEVADENL